MNVFSLQAELEKGGSQGETTLKATQVLFLGHGRQHGTNSSCE